MTIDNIIGSFLKACILVALCILPGAFVAANEGLTGPVQLPKPPPPQEPRLPMDTQLWRAEAKYIEMARHDFEQVRDDFSRRGMRLRDDGRVHVEVVGPSGEDAIPASLVESVGGEVNLIWRHRADLWVPADRLSDLARQLPEGYFLERPHPNDTDHQGTITTNSQSYIDGGSDGSGITIAVIDIGYDELVDAQAAGTAPSGGQLWTGGGDWPGSGNHGTGSTESVFAHAPEANYRLYSTRSISQAADAVDDAIENGADIITHSLSRYNQGWADDSGDACEYANTASRAGVLFFTSAGNRARKHWQGVMNSSDNEWHQFSGSDQTIRVELPNEAGATFYLQWDDSTDSYLYDLYLFEEVNGSLEELDSDTGPFADRFKTIRYENDTGDTQYVHVAVHHRAGGNTELELFMHGRDGGRNFQHQVPESSTTSPSNCLGSNVISNGAVSWVNHDEPSGATGIATGYSSRGPTNGGRTRPHLAGPTNVSTTCCGGAFGGTSSAAPNNAGMAAALWSAHPNYRASAIRWLIYRKAALWKDWGAAGKNNTYGHGGTLLADFVPNSVWLARGYLNSNNEHRGPYYTAQAAYDYAPNGSTIRIFPGGSYPEPVDMSGSKSVRVESIELDATIGN